MKSVEFTKGIVISLDKKTMVVVTEQGDFLRVSVPVPRPRPGETIQLPLPKPRSFPKYYLRGIAAALLIITLALGMLKPVFMPQAVAAVSMDLASSIELNVDRENRIIGAKAMDAEGQAVLERLNLKGEDVYQAVNLVAVKAVELGYLQKEQGNTVIVAVVPLKEQARNAIDREKLQQILHDELAKREFQGYLVVDNAELSIRQEAAKAGLTVNQYLLWERSKAGGAELSIEELKSQPLEQVMRGSEDKMERMFPGMWCRVGERGPKGKGPVNQQPQLIPQAGQGNSECGPMGPRNRGCGW